MLIHRREKEDQNIWNFFFSVLFGILLALSCWQIYLTYGFFPQGVPVFDAVLMALAVLRITRLLVYDKITRFAREWFLQKRTVVENGKEFIELKEFQKGFRHTIHDLLQCPWCVAVWASLVVVFCYFEFTWSWYVIFMLAVAGVGSLLQVSANAIGWYAEAKKTATLEMRRSKTIETGRE